MVPQISICSNGKTQTTYGCTLQLCSREWVLIGTEIYTANIKKEIEYSVQLVGLELNIYLTKMYGTTNIKDDGTVRLKQL
jgi:hypothetical protein